MTFPLSQTTSFNTTTVVSRANPTYAVVSYIHSYHTVYDVKHQYYSLSLLINGSVILLQSSGMYQLPVPSSVFSLSSNVMVTFYVFLPQTPKPFMSTELKFSCSGPLNAFWVDFPLSSPTPLALPLWLCHAFCAWWNFITSAVLLISFLPLIKNYCHNCKAIILPPV